MAAYITVGAKTTHGGTVISGSAPTTHNGIPVARIADKVLGKKCKKSSQLLWATPLISSMAVLLPVMAILHHVARS